MSTAAEIAGTIFDICCDRSTLFHCVVGGAEFKERFLTSHVEVKAFFLFIHSGYCGMLKTDQIEDRTEEVAKVLLTSLDVHLYAKKDSRISDYIITIFPDRRVPVPLLNGCSVLKWSLEPDQKSMSSP